MPVCEQCDGESFYEEDGRFFCDSCHLQSQDRQVEHQQEVDTENFNDGTRGLTLKSIGKKKSRRKFKTNELGKPWTVYEGYQYLIKRQVESLIAMGFSDELKPVVGKLWFRYLKLKKVAFCPEEPDVITLKEHSGRTKNEGEWNTWLKKRRKLWKDDSTAPQVAENVLSTINENTTLMEGDGKKMEMDEHAPIDQNQKELPVKEKRESLDASIENGKMTTEYNDELREKDEDQDENDLDNTAISNDINVCDSIGSHPLKKEPVFPMNQVTTLYFCYLGLTLLREPVLLSDLLRWSHEGHLPYHKASVVLPKEMKFAANDHKKFSTKYKLLCDHDAAKSISLLYRTMGIDFTPDWEYIKLLSIPVLVDMDFSSSVQPLVWWLVDVDSKISPLKVHRSSKRETYKRRCDLDCYQCGKPVMDFLVASYLVVALKIIYHFDDIHEVRNEVRKHVLKDLKLGDVENWTSWVKRTMIKRAKKLYSGIPREEEDLKYIHDLTVYEDYSVKDAFKDFNIRVATQPYQNNMGTWRHRKDMSQVQDSRQEHFETYYSIARLVNPMLDLENVERRASSFPCSVDPLGKRVSCCDPVQKPDVSGADYAMHTCSCLASNWKDICGAQDASNSLAETVIDSSGDKLMDASEIVASSNTLTGVTNQEEVSQSNMDSQEQLADIIKETNVPSSPPRKPISKICEDSPLLHPMLAPCDHYIHYTKTDGEDAWSDSYKYLLNVMAQRMETLPIELQPYIQALETRLFGEMASGSDVILNIQED